VRKVFVLNNGGKDYSDAERFGDIVFCTQGSLDKWNISQMYRDLEMALMDAQADDLILLDSLASLCSTASAMMAFRFGEVHYLIYKDGKYIQRDLMLENE